MFSYISVVPYPVAAGKQAERAVAIAGLIAKIRR
jgi:hypothetical protein